MQYPKISIVTPCYNDVTFIESTITSVLNQGYPNLEYIVIDGGSTDGSKEIIQRYQSQLSYWCSEKDEGMYDALQKGFEKCTGEIMSWINSDDVLAKNSLYTVSEIFQDFKNIRWISGTPNQMDETGRIISTEGVPKWNKYKYLNLDFKYIQQEGIFWRRSLWEESGSKVAKNMQLAGDLELWSRFFQQDDLYYITGILGTFRVRKSNQKSLEHIDEYNREATEILKAMPRSKEERRNMEIKNSVFWRLSQKKYLNALFKIFKYKDHAANMNHYPPCMVYDRFKQRFIVQ